MYEQVLQLLTDRNFKRIREIFIDMNEADVASLLQRFHDDHEADKRDLIVLFRLLNKDIAADVFSYMDSDMQMMLINAFTDKELQEVIDDLYVDDTVDIIEEMPANVVARILRSADSETRKQINQILKYPKDSAGSVMTTEYVYLRKDYTVREALEWIRHIGVVKETVYTLYVTESRVLIGVLSLLDLITADETDRIEDIMETNIISVSTLEDRELVASKMAKYDFAAMPVVDKDMRLVGIITYDDAMDVIEVETTEDFSKMAAVAPSEDSYFKTSVMKHAKNRIMWLLVLMLSATLTGAVVNKYQSAFAAVPVLVSFLSMLSGTGGNCGSQTSTLVIRGMALGEINMRDFFKVLFKELRVAVVCGIILSIVNAGRIILVYHNDTSVDCYKLAFTVSGAILLTVILSKLIAAMLPMAAKKLKLDPAIMAAPLITTIVDTCSTLMFFALATVVFDIK
ncbi:MULTISPECIES: magnesium transporter [Ruminococcus]|uniref:Magnesium transporter MgtE n=1 Tax=Ruminococcus albus 8 TaxID=246199 RepID=E9SI22_RUMAL|nr:MULTISPECIES: magnesium transporter [Ruminococcus]EGC01094.1 magnesium transporter [Ruminococcus albus 8]MBO5559780.1 magnesium transporter [Ruminococcus sp.]MCC3352566.1 magnesium transporter [Ruminococcus albus 8]